MKAYLAATFIALSTTAAACASQRQVEVKTGTQQVAEVSLRVTNNLTQAVNVYVTNGGSDIFLKQVAANGTESMAVPGVPAGATVMLKATPVDGSKTYTRDNVTLTASYEWTVP
jgi:hypothetical protein